MSGSSTAGAAAGMVWTRFQRATNQLFSSQWENVVGKGVKIGALQQTPSGDFMIDAI